MKRHAPYHFQTNPEFGEDFQAISKAAYFDYQRSRIYWRTSGNAKAKQSFSSEKQDTKRVDRDFLRAFCNLIL